MSDAPKFWKRSTWRYPNLSFWENFFGGYITIGPVTIYGENAMHWAVNIKTKRGYFCFSLPFRCFGVRWPQYCYLSPNGTPQHPETKHYYPRRREADDE